MVDLKELDGSKSVKDNIYTLDNNVKAVTESVEGIKTDVEELTERTSYKYVKTFTRNSPTSMENKTWKLSFPKTDTVLRGKIKITLVSYYWNTNANGYIEKEYNITLYSSGENRQYSSRHTNKDSWCGDKFSLGEIYWDEDKWSLLIKSNSPNSHNGFKLIIEAVPMQDITNFQDIELSECYSDETPNNDNGIALATYKTEDISTTLQNGWEIKYGYNVLICKCGSIVNVVGLIANGVTEDDTTIINVPNKYRPRGNRYVRINVSDGKQVGLVICANGDVMTSKDWYQANYNIFNFQYII